MLYIIDLAKFVMFSIKCCQILVNTKLAGINESIIVKCLNIYSIFKNQVNINLAGTSSHILIALEAITEQKFINKSYQKKSSDFEYKCNLNLLSEEMNKQEQKINKK